MVELRPPQPTVTRPLCSLEGFGFTRLVASGPLVPGEQSRAVRLGTGGLCARGPRGEGTSQGNPNMPQ